MANSGPRELHIDKLLSQMALGYFANAGIAEQIAPTVTVDKQTDLYMVYSRADALRIEDTRRAPDTEARKITRSVSSDSYHAENYALKYPITIEDKSNMDAMHMQHLYEGRVRFLTDKLSLDWENRVAGLVTTAANVGSATNVSTSWNLATADPLADIHAKIDHINDTTGKRPNRIAMGEAAWRTLRRHSDIRNILFGTNNGGGYPNTRQVADLLEVEQILVSNAFKNTGNEAQSESLSRIWLDHVLVYYAPSAPSREDPSFMYSFRWAAQGLPNMQVERHPYDTRRKSEEVEVGYYQDEKVTGSEYGGLLLYVNSGQ